MSVLVTSQLPTEITKFLYSFLRALVPPTLKKVPPPMAISHVIVYKRWKTFWSTNRRRKDFPVDKFSSIARPSSSPAAKILYNWTLSVVSTLNIANDHLSQKKHWCRKLGCSLWGHTVVWPNNLVRLSANVSFDKLYYQWKSWQFFFKR